MKHQDLALPHWGIQIIYLKTKIGALVNSIFKSFSSMTTFQLHVLNVNKYFVSLFYNTLFRDN